MAEKHKSKYKAPKDEAKSLKAETRKDMKDYTAEDAPNMVPGGVKGVQPNVPRKYATDVIDNIENMVPEIKDRLYKKIEDGEYSAADARKLFDKLRIKDAEEFLKKLERIDHGAITNSMVKPENEEKLQERVNRLSEENKERLIREYVRRKIAIMIREQAEETEEEPVAAEPAPEPIPEPTATPEAPAAAPTPETPATAEAPTPEAPADTPTLDGTETGEAGDPDAQLQAEKGPVAQFQELLIGRIINQPKPEEKATAVMLNILKNTIQQIEVKTGEEVSKTDMRRDIIIWMQNNGLFSNKQINVDPSSAEDMA
jgi:hypothetical protein